VPWRVWSRRKPSQSQERFRPRARLSPVWSQSSSTEASGVIAMHMGEGAALSIHLHIPTPNRGPSCTQKVSSPQPLVASMKRCAGKRYTLKRDCCQRVTGDNTGAPRLRADTGDGLVPGGPHCSDLQPLPLTDHAQTHT